MTLQRVGTPQHTGEERYEVKLTYTLGDVELISKMAQPGEIITDTVYLVFVRRVGGSWERYTRGTHGSRAVGNEKVVGITGAVGPRKAREIFTRDVGNLTAWADRLPGLRAAVEKAEAELPRYQSTARLIKAVG